jgi:hypothetical protein
VAQCRDRGAAGVGAENLKTVKGTAPKKSKEPGVSSGSQKALKVPLISLLVWERNVVELWCQAAELCVVLVFVADI